jgi:ankyrin repeat protein
VENGADVNSMNNLGERPIHIICQNFGQRVDIIKYLVEKGANLDYKDVCGWKPLHYICMIKDAIDSIKYIIDNTSDLECEVCPGWSPLILLLAYSTDEAVLYLLSKNVKTIIDGPRYYGTRCLNIHIFQISYRKFLYYSWLLLLLFSSLFSSLLFMRKLKNKEYL